MQHRFIISGGGTGGHIFPAVAIANALSHQLDQSEVLFVGAIGKMEMDKIPKAGYDIVGLEITGLNRSNPLKNISLPYKLLKSNQKAKSIISDFDPHAVIGTGGYASFPVVHAAQGFGIPTFIQEQNAFAGKANQRLGRKASAIFTAFEDMSEFFDTSKTYDYGNPVRKSIYQNIPSRLEALQHMGLNPEHKTISIVGGSLGALSINEQIAKHLPELQSEGVQVIWQTGASYYDTALRVAAGMEGVVVVDFIQKIQMLYCAADVIISRAGASAIAELALMERAVIFVPFPHAAEDHQRKNAERIVDKNAATMVLDHEMEDKLLSVLQNLLTDTELQNTYSQNIAKLAVKDADDKIAKKIIETIDG